MQTNDEVSLELALSTVDVSVDDIDLAANCHLHFDHCGGNAFFAGKPILTQASELVSARTVVDYTMAELIDTPGNRYEELAGEAEVLPGVILIPAPDTPKVSSHWLSESRMAPWSLPDRVTTPPLCTALTRWRGALTSTTIHSRCRCRRAG